MKFIRKDDKGQILLIIHRSLALPIVGAIFLLLGGVLIHFFWEKQVLTCAHAGESGQVDCQLRQIGIFTELRRDFIAVTGASVQATTGKKSSSTYRVALQTTKEEAQPLTWYYSPEREDKAELAEQINSYISAEASAQNFKWEEQIWLPALIGTFFAGLGLLFFIFGVQTYILPPFVHIDRINGQIRIRSRAGGAKPIKNLLVAQVEAFDVVDMLTALQDWQRKRAANQPGKGAIAERLISNLNQIVERQESTLTQQKAEYEEAKDKGSKGKHQMRLRLRDGSAVLLGWQTQARKDQLEVWASELNTFIGRKA